MFNKIKKEVIELLKDKATISWCYNKYLEEIFDKYKLFDNQKVYLDITTRLCLELSEEFHTYELDDDLIISTREIEFYLHLGRLLECLNKEFTKEEMVKAVEEMSTQFNCQLEEQTIDKLYEILKDNNIELVKQTMFIIYVD